MHFLIVTLRITFSKAHNQIQGIFKAFQVPNEIPGIFQVFQAAIHPGEPPCGPLVVDV